MGGESGYITFYKSDIDEERQAATENDEPELVTYKRLWISPRKLAQLPEFQGW